MMRSVLVAMLAACSVCVPESSVNAASPTKSVEPVVQIGHPNRLRHVVFSPDDKYFVTTAFGKPGPHGGNDEHVILWDAETGDKLRAFRANAYQLRPVFCLERQLLLIGGDVWDMQSGQLRHTIRQGDEVPIDMRLSHDARQVIVGMRNGPVRVVDLETGEQVAELSNPKAEDVDDPEKAPAVDRWRVYAVAFNRENVPLAAARHESTDRLAVWNVKAKTIQMLLDNDYFDRARFSPDGRYVVTRHWSDTGSNIEEIHVFHAFWGTQLVKSVGWWNDSDFVEFTPDGRYCVTGTATQNVTLWDLDGEQKSVHTFGGHDKPIYGTRLLNDGKVLETRSYDAARRWNLKTGKMVQVFEDPEYDPEEQKSPDRRGGVVVPTRDGKTFICGSRLYDATSGELLRAMSRPMSFDERWRGLSSGVGMGRYLPNGKFAICHYNNDRSSFSGVINLTSGAIIQELSRPIKRHDLQWNYDARRALVRYDRVAWLWDAVRGRPLQRFGLIVVGRQRATSWGTPRLAFSPNGKFAYMPGRTLALWDAETGEPLNHDPPSVGPGNQRGLLDGNRHWQYYEGKSALSPDGRLAAGQDYFQGGWKSAMLIRDLRTGQIIREFDHPGMIADLPAFSPDGRSLAVACWCRKPHPQGRGFTRAWEIVLWDVPSGKKLHTLPWHEDSLSSGRPTMSFLSDNRRLLVHHAARTIALYDTKTGAIIHEMVDTSPLPKQPWEKYLHPEWLIGPNERYVVAGYGWDDAIVWNLQTGKEVRRIHSDMPNKSIPERFAFSLDGSRIRLRQQTGAIWDLGSRESGKLEADDDQGWRFPEPPPRPTPLDTDPADGQEVPQRTLDRMKHAIPENAIAVKQTADGQKLIVYHANGRIAFWNLARKELVRDCYQFHNSSRWVTVLPDGTCRGNLEYVRFRKPGTIELVEK